MKMMISLLIMFGMFLLVGTKLASGASWSAYVLESGAGLNDVNINAVLESNNDLVNSTLSDVNGFFIIGFPDSTSVKLISSKSGYITDTSQSLPRISTDAILSFNISLEKALPGNITGKITDSTGSGIENVNVSAIQGNSIINSTLTDSNGDYIIAYLLDGTYTIGTSALGYTIQNTTNVALLPNSITSLSFSLDPDATPPVITSVSANLITSSEAVIIWQTDELTNSKVNYGTTTLKSSSSSSSTLTTSHLIRLSSLSSNTLYYYNVSSCDFAGNCDSSEQFSFTTLSISVSLGEGSGGGGVSNDSGQGITTEDEQIKKQLFDITFNLIDNSIKDILELTAIISFENFGAEPTLIKLLFTILDQDGKEVHSEEDQITVETEKILRKSFGNADLPNGEYTLILTTLYNINVVDEFRQDFKIGRERRGITGSVIGVFGKGEVWYSILIFGIVLLIGFVVYFIRKYAMYVGKLEGEIAFERRWIK